MAEVTQRPWLASYPEGIDWNVEIDTTPVHERVLAMCEKTPNADALDFLGRKTRFRELGAAIEAFAGALQQKFGVKKGTRVAMLLPNTPFYVIAYYGVLRAGGTVVNCNPLYTVGELSHIVGNSGAELMVTLDVAQVFKKAEAVAREGHLRDLIVCHFPDVLPAVKKVLYKVAKSGDLAKPADSPIADRITPFDKLLAGRHKPTPVSIDAEHDIAIQQYTGGTTGLPRGAMLSHANVSANVSQLGIWGDGLFNPPTRIVAVLPFFHIFAMTACMNLPLCHGAQVVMMPRFDMKGLLDLLVRTGANVMPAVPTLVQTLARGGEKASAALNTLELVVCGGAPLTEEVVEAWSKVSRARVAEGYGLTESSPVVCCAALAVASKPHSIGLPIPGTDIRMVDIETGEVVPTGERGELQVKGPQVMRGYFGDDDATRNAFTDGWLRSGDVGIMDEDGYVFIVDRIKDLIICSGFNIYPRNVEEALMHHPAVDEVTVIGVPDPRRGEAPVAFVKLKDGAEATESELKAFASDHLSKLEVPREIIFKAELPKTLIGKLSKKELRQEYGERKSHDEPA
ncbi:long-chain-fatty-acid--CoA ligase [Devosia sp.]|uniref:long-chain-fatty-acid--CoA ligase n=1 Tax=Devosia sp. TaxID=1871048 RepID=UPI003A90886B